MNILVIGNGFDLAHSLPTKYSDFIMFIKNFNNTKDMQKEDIKKLSMFNDLPKAIQEYLLKDEVFYKEQRKEWLIELEDLSKDSLWLQYFIDSVDYNNKGWIDFESEISKVIVALEYLIDRNKHNIRTNEMDYIKNDEEKNKIINTFFKVWNMKNSNKGEEAIGSREFYGESLKDCIDIIQEELNKLIRCLEIYIGIVIDNIDIECKLAEIEKLKIDKVISFNYTNTYERVYQSENNKVEYDYLHGNAELNRDIKNNNMVLGIDEYLVGKEKDEKLDLIAFKKYFQRIYKKTGCKYKEWLESTGEFQKRQAHIFLKQGEVFLNNIYFYGHSLDVTDKDILKDLFEFPYTQITIFYLDEYDYAQKISNVIKIIGQDKLISEVHGKNPKIVFNEIQK